MARRPKVSMNLDAVSELPSVFEGYTNEVTPELRDALRHELIFFREEMRDRSSIGPLIARSEKLKLSWYVEVTGETMDKLAGKFVNYKPYAAIHELGGTTYPSGKWLWIPISYNRLPSGKTLYTQKQTFNMIQSNVFSYGRFIDEGSDKFGVRDEKGDGIWVLVKKAVYKPQLETVKRSHIREEKIVERMNQIVFNGMVDRLKDQGYPTSNL